MSRRTAWWLHLATLSAGATGLTMIWLVYLAEPPETDPDSFSVVTDPVEPWARAIHILAGPMLLFGIGLVWRAHVWARLRAGRLQRRRTGLLLAVLAPVMVLSGYGLQVIEDETLRTWCGYGHAGSGGSFVVVYLVHQLSRRSTQATTSSVRHAVDPVTD